MELIQTWQKKWKTYLKENEEKWASSIPHNVYQSLQDSIIIDTHYKLEVFDTLYLPVYSFDLQIQGEIIHLAQIRGDWYRDGTHEQETLNTLGESLASCFQVTEEQGNMLNELFNNFSFLRLAADVQTKREEEESFNKNPYYGDFYTQPLSTKDKIILRSPRLQKFYKPYFRLTRGFLIALYLPFVLFSYTKKQQMKKEEMNETLLKLALKCAKPFIKHYERADFMVNAIEKGKTYD